MKFSIYLEKTKKLFNITKKVIFRPLYRAGSEVFPQAFGSIVLSIISVCAKIYFPILLKDLIEENLMKINNKNRIITGLEVTNTQLFNIGDGLIFLTFVWFLSNMTKNLVPYIRENWVLSSIESLTDDIVEHVNHIPLDVFDQKNKGEFLNSIVNIPRVTERFFKVSFEFCEEIAEIISTTYAISKIYNSHFLIKIIAPIIVFLDVSMRVYHINQQTKIRIKMHLCNEKFIENTSNFLTNHQLILMYKSQAYENKFHKSCFSKMIKKSIENNKLSSRLDIFQSFLSSCGFFLLNYYLFREINIENNKGTIAQLNFHYFGLMKILERLGKSVTIFSDSFVDIKKISDIFSLQRISTLNKKQMGNKYKLINYPLGIKFSNIIFGFFDKNKNNYTAILKKTNLRIPRGAITIISGNTGTGKTSIARLIVGLYRPSSGKINFYKSEYLDHKECEAKISFESTDVQLFNNRSIYENIFYNIDIESITHTQFEMIIRACCLNTVIEDIPTAKIKPVFQLSTGEKKRLSLARGILKSIATKANIIIFDEPTSNLDEDTRDIVMNNILALCKNKTVIIISHDPEIRKFGTHFLKLEKNKLIIDDFIQSKSRINKLTLISSN